MGSSDEALLAGLAARDQQAASDLDGDLGVAERPEGPDQVTLDGRRLYSFADDPGPGEVTGDGFSDTSDGQRFTRHVAGPAGVSGGSTSTDDGFDYSVEPR